jgi:energy-converting hydrogenase Eha subunit F
MRILASTTLIGLLAGGLTGCAHNKANQYAYAPPLAPPVYPQPQPATPMMAAAPVAPPGAVGIPATQPAMVTAAGVAPAFAGQTVGGDPCCPPLDGAAIPVVYESAVQTTPCPPGP